MRSQLSNLKDKLPIEMRSGVVPRSVCDKSYIGETLGDRIKEHKVACTRCEKEKPAIAEDAWEKVILWHGEKTAILNSDRRRFGLVLKEALHISTHKTPLLMNRDTGLGFLDAGWQLLTRMPNNMYMHAQYALLCYYLGK